MRVTRIGMAFSAEQCIADKSRGREVQVFDHCLVAP